MSSVAPALPARARSLLGAGLLCLLAASACKSSRDLPMVQFSSTRPRDADVKVTRTLVYAPACTTISAGQTVEWWVDPAAPQVAVNVTSVGTPVELFSPSLVKPLVCDRSMPDRVCWRHTFETAGCFPYYDTNSGNPGRPVVDDYYGTVSFVGASGEVTRGLVCVEGPGVTCRGVCCNANFDCDPGFTCQAGRCTATDGQPSPCPGTPPRDLGTAPADMARADTPDLTTTTDASAGDLQ